MKIALTMLLLTLGGCATAPTARDLTPDEQAVVNRGAAVCAKVSQKNDCFTTVPVESFRAAFGPRLTQDDVEAYFAAQEFFKQYRAEHEAAVLRSRSGRESAGAALQGFSDGWQRSRGTHCRPDYAGGMVCQ